MPRMFGAAAAEYFRKCGGGVEHLAKIAAKNHKHPVHNPYAQFRVGHDEAAVLASPQISNELTKFMCSPTSDGAACCILATCLASFGLMYRRGWAYASTRTIRPTQRVGEVWPCAQHRAQRRSRRQPPPSPRVLPRRRPK
ncbi:hypothetical protein EDB92DRAFT_2118090, partial [Lactarius akahatsu]